MDRRSMLRKAGGIALIGCSAGCSSLAENGIEQTPTPTPQPDPRGTISEELVEGTKYRVVADVQLNGAEELEVRKGTTGGELVTTISTSGSHRIAGPETEYGPAESPTSFRLVHVTRSEATDVEIPELVASHMVGSEVQPSFPFHLNGLTGSTAPDIETSEYLSRTFTQSGGMGRTQLSLRIPEILYDYYSNRERTRNYGAYVSDTYDDQYVKGIVDEFERYGNENDLSDVGIIDHMMQFVQNLEYTSDRVSAGFNEYPKYPVETLVDREGDCEDTCILLASMLEQFGYGTVLIGLPDDQHMALGIAGAEDLPGTYYEKGGKRYYYVETTSPGWTVGEKPSEVSGRNAEIYDVNDHGVLVFNYAVQIRPESGVETRIKLLNVGDAAGTATTKVEFENSENVIRASAESRPTTIRPDEQTETALHLSPPDDETLRARVTVFLDGARQDSVVSDWSEPVEAGPGS